MESWEDNGKFYASPTLFQNPRPLEEGQDEWEDLSGKPNSIDEAIKRGEFFEYPTKDASERAAEGDWKQENLEESILNALLKYNIK